MAGHSVSQVGALFNFRAPYFNQVHREARVERADPGHVVIT
jgi:hypothetical protein